MKDNKNRALLPIYVQNIATLSDGAVKIIIVTQELTAQGMADLFQFHRNQGYMLLTTELISDTSLLDNKKIEPITKNKKSLSAQLRNVLYRQWEQQNTGETFETFYEKKMKNAIEKVKATLL